MRRVMRVLGSAAGAAALVGLLAAPASAARLSRASISLACDRGVSGSVVFEIYSADGAPIHGFSGHLECGDLYQLPAHMREAFAADVPDAVSVQLTMGASTVPGGCEPTGGPLPFRGECADAGGSGVKVTVR
jgi:hypothetical protein